MRNILTIKSVLTLLAALSGLLGGLPEGRGQNNRGITADATVQFYYSPNPVKDSTKFKFDDVIRVDLHKLINEKGATNKGIIGDVPGGSKRTTVPTGNPIPGSNNGISIEMYTYDSTSTTGEGKFLFGLYATATFTTYDWQHWNVPQSVAPYYFRSFRSDDIEGLAMKALGKKGASRVVPVVFKATIKSATLKSFAIPHLGSFDAWGLFKNGTFPKPNGMVAVGCHRGYWEGVKDPENTYNAVGAALSRNFEIVELDMWRTSDNQVVVFHDMGLNKRTTSTGPVNTRTLANLQMMNVRNRFDELINDVSGKSNIRSLAQVFAYRNTYFSNSRTWFNLDRAANPPTGKTDDPDPNFVTFGLTYTAAKNAGLLDRTIFKGRYPVSVSQIDAAFTKMGITNIATKKAMFFTPVLFDSTGKGNPTDALIFKNYIDSWINSGLADGFELTYKAYPQGSPRYATNNNADILLLQKWDILGGKNFVEYIHDQGFPVGIFASTPEVCAIPNYDPVNGSRDVNVLKSGFVRENAPDKANPYVPNIGDQQAFDFRGDWDFYVPAGADYVLTDRPDALLKYLKAAKKHL